MAIEVTEWSEVELLQPEADQHAMSASSYSGLAVVQAGRWIAVSPELGTVAEGDTADEALNLLQAAVLDVIEIATEEHLPKGSPLEPDDIAELIREHRRNTTAPVTMRSLIVRA